jgi:1-acyl-sn-glycerol-3-phosphate acyltransferase
VLSTRERVGLRVQGALSQGLILVTYHSIAAWLRSRGYVVPGRHRVRAEFEAQVARTRGPLLICANHLTLIDSLIIQWALTPGWRLVLRPDLFSWNLPDRQNLSKNRLIRILGYFCKCIPVVRRASPEETRRTLDKVALLLARGQSVLVFPEGGRSRVGHVDTENFMYGVGRMLQESPNTRVLCVFARGRGQDVYSSFPKRGESFFVRLRPTLRPSTRLTASTVSAAMCR